MENVNYDNAKFSLAKIDFRNYIQVLLSIEKKLDEANFVYDYVMKRAEKTQDTIDMLRTFSFTEYAKVQQYLKQVKKSILKYQSELKQFLSENQEKEQEFYELLDQLIPLVEQYERIMEEKIAKCFKVFDEFNGTKTL